jgi:hypothetical protein
MLICFGSSENSKQGAEELLVESSTVTCVQLNSAFPWDRKLGIAGYILFSSRRTVSRIPASERLKINTRSKISESLCARLAAAFRNQSFLFEELKIPNTK